MGKCTIFTVFKTDEWQKMWSTRAQYNSVQKITINLAYS